jgi:thioredoxin 2
MTQTTAMDRPVTVRCPFCRQLNRVDLARLADGPRCGECRRPLHFDRPVHSEEADLDELLRTAGVPVVLDFYADWCGPCRAMAPALDELAGRYAGRILVVKVDTDRNQGAALRFGVRGVPTLVAVESGREIRRHVGMADLPTLEALAGLR